MVCSAWLSLAYRPGPSLGGGVVVDDGAVARVGKSLMRHAMEQAKKLGAKTLDLTSRPSREAANKLYQSLGFETRQTNVYRYLG